MGQKYMLYEKWGERQGKARRKDNQGGTETKPRKPDKKRKWNV